MPSDVPTDPLPDEVTQTQPPRRPPLGTTAGETHPTGNWLASLPGVLPDVEGYNLVREVGHGGMGVVYEAVQRGLNRRVALKMVRAGRFSGTDQLVRFLIEAEMLARLRHPNIVQIHEVGHCDGVPFFALEYLDGGTLAEATRGKPLDPRQAVAVAERLARAVQHAHAHGVVHRDLKPQNVLLQKEEGGRTKEESEPSALSGFSVILQQSSFIPKITDFGLARSTTDSTGVTETGAIMGTPSYMSPEQAAGRRDVGPAADVYALGAVLYQLLTGKPPFHGETAAQTIQQVLHDAPISPRKTVPSVPRDLDVICLKCLDKDPVRRYASADALADDLRRFLDGRPITARPVGSGERAWRWAKRNPAVAALLAALMMVLASGVAGIAWKWREAEERRAEAEDAAGKVTAALGKAEANFALAQEAVDKYLSGVSDSEELKDPAQAKLRKKLIGTAREFYQKFADERATDPTAREKLGTAYRKLAEIAWHADTDATAAREFATKSRDVYTALAADRPGEVAFTRGRLEADNWVAFSTVRLRELDPGFALWHEVVAGFRGMAAGTDLEADHDRHAREAYALGVDLFLHERFAAAAAAHRESVGVRRRLHARLPDHPRYGRDLSWGLLQLGYVLRVLRDPAAVEALAEAEGHYRAALAGDPTDAESLHGLGGVLFNLGMLARNRNDPDAALTYWAAAADRFTAYLQRSTSPDARAGLARAYLFQAEVRLGRKQYDLAEALARQAVGAAALTGDVTTGTVRVLLGCAAARPRSTALVEYAGSVLNSYRAIPSDALTQNNLAWQYATFPDPAFRDPGRAVDLARKAVAARPDEGAFLGTLGAAEYAAGNYAAARDAIDKAAGRPGSGAVNGFFRTMTLARLGDPAGAKAALDAAAAGPPDPGKEDEFARLRDEARAVLGLGGSAAVAAARTEYRVAWDLDQPGFDAWLAALTSGDWVPTAIHVHPTAAGPRYVAVAASSRGPVVWEVRTDTGVDAFQRRFESLSARNLRPLSLCGFTDGGVVKYTGAWSAVGPANLLTRHVADPAFVLKEAAKLRAAGGRVVSLSVFPLDGPTRVTTIYNADQGKDSDLRFDLTPVAYAAAVAEYRAKGWRPGPVAPAVIGGKLTFAVAGVHDPKAEWVARHDLTAAEAAAEHARLTTAGYRPECVGGYDPGGGSRYLGVWVKDPFTPPPAPPPATGEAVPDLAGFDKAVQTFMTERSIPAGAVAVMKGGKLVFSRGYGHLDRGRTKPTPPDTPFRLASVTKPITAAAVRRLIADGKLDEEAKVVPLLGLTVTDPRWSEVTVGQLLTHRGGFDRAKAGDPMFQSAEVSKALSLSGPPTAADVVTFMAGRPLQFDPDAKAAYSNFGYCVLGRVIEKVSGKAYPEFVRDEVLAPVGVRGIALGRTLPEHRDPREPFYSDPSRGKDVMHPGAAGAVPTPDGGFHLEAMDAHGGLIGSAPDLVRFLHHYGIDGRPVGPGAKAAGTHFGSLPGTFAVMTRRADGVLMAALFNQRADPSGLEYGVILDKLNAAAAAVTRWPTP